MARRRRNRLKFPRRPDRRAGKLHDPGNIWKSGAEKKIVMDFKSYLDSRRIQIDKALKELLPPLNLFPEQIHEAMHYPLFAGGKRLRPILMMAACDAVGGNGEKFLPQACAIELIHTYSLVHDDLPSMDNDDYRRGQPTVHRKFGEAVAILAGDALLTEAFYLLSSFCRSVEEKALSADLAVLLSFAAGSRGMVGGQAIDLAWQGKKEVSESSLRTLHRLKTGALIAASVKMGGIAGGADSSRLKSLETFGESLGLAFQIADDILDIEGSPESLGKTVGKDAKDGKITFPSVIGLQASRNLAEELAQKCLEALSEFDQ